MQIAYFPGFSWEMGDQNVTPAGTSLGYPPEGALRIITPVILKIKNPN